MAPVPNYLLLLWLSWWRAIALQVTESHKVLLPCILDNALADLNLIWFGPSKKELLYVNVRYHRADTRLDNMWGLLIYNNTRQNETWFTCNWNGISGKSHLHPNSTSSDDSENIQKEIKEHAKTKSYEDVLSTAQPITTSGFSVGHQEDFLHSWSPEYFPCDAPVLRNWTAGTLLWIQHDSLIQNVVLINMTIRRSIRYSLDMNSGLVSLILPSVTFEDAGNYSCHWKNQTYHLHLEVIAKRAVSYWIIWSVALGYMLVCLSSLFCFLWLQQANRTRRQRMKLMDSARRRDFYAKWNKRHNTSRILMSQANDDDELVDAFSYENVLPGMGRPRGQRLQQKGKILPNAINIEEIDTRRGGGEEYECLDSETELKSEGGENYENTQEEVKHGDVLLCDVLVYENNKVKSCLHRGCSDDENYVNLEEDSPLSPGAEQLIAGLHLQLALSSQEDRQDGGSEPSTGSQSYEEMNGSLSPGSKPLCYLHPNTSNEEDADSYENMESPTNLSSWKEGNLDPHGEGVLFHSRWQHVSVLLGVDLRGGFLCSE